MPATFAVVNNAKIPLSDAYLLFFKTASFPVGLAAFGAAITTAPGNSTGNFSPFRKRKREKPSLAIYFLAVGIPSVMKAPIALTVSV